MLMMMLGRASVATESHSHLPFGEQIFIYPWGCQARGTITGDELGQGLDDRRSGTGEHKKGLGRKGADLFCQGLLCKAALGGTLVAHGWQILCRFGCQAQAEWGSSMKQGSSPLQWVSKHCHCSVELHTETRQLWKEAGHLTWNMSYVYEPTDVNHVLR